MLSKLLESVVYSKKEIRYRKALDSIQETTRRIEKDLGYSMNNYSFTLQLGIATAKLSTGYTRVDKYYLTLKSLALFCNNNGLKLSDLCMEVAQINVSHLSHYYELLLKEANFEIDLDKGIKEDMISFIFSNLFPENEIKNKEHLTLLFEDINIKLWVQKE